MEQTEQQGKTRRSRGTTLGIYFPGLSKQEANAVRERLNALAAKQGYLAERGETAGKGAAGRMLMALARGDLQLCQGENESLDAE